MYRIKVGKFVIQEYWPFHVLEHMKGDVALSALVGTFDLALVLSCVGAASTVLYFVSFYVL